jgi:hypothetical protein
MLDGLTPASARVRRLASTIRDPNPPLIPLRTLSRRALLLAGGAAVLGAGCGRDGAPKPPAPSTVLLRELAAERAFATALAGTGQRRLASRARRRATELASAISAHGGRPHEAPAPSGGGNALERGRAVLVAHVTALPSLTGDERALAADLLTGASGDVALLEAALGASSDDPFPGTPQ